MDFGFTDGAVARGELGGGTDGCVVEALEFVLVET
uniref:Uncharacterized protein n=1 Tax=Arundo donax TaxID=35708 RepID=A0A0A8ZTQ8_ARUDO